MSVRMSNLENDRDERDDDSHDDRGISEYLHGLRTNVSAGGQSRMNVLSCIKI